MNLPRAVRTVLDVPVAQLLEPDLHAMNSFCHDWGIPSSWLILVVLITKLDTALNPPMDSHAS